MSFIIYKKENPSLLVLCVDSSNNPQLTTNESMAMAFSTAADATTFLNSLNPSGSDFWGTRPTRPR